MTRGARIDLNRSEELKNRSEDLRNRSEDLKNRSEERWMTDMDITDISISTVDDIIIIAYYCNHHRPASDAYNVLQGPARVPVSGGTHAAEPRTWR